MKLSKVTFLGRLKSDTPRNIKNTLKSHATFCSDICVIWYLQVEYALKYLGGVKGTMKVSCILLLAHICNNYL